MEASRGAEHVRVPNVVGLALQEVSRRLYEASLVTTYGERERLPYADDRPPGPLAVRTDPPAGSRVPAGSAVTVHIGVPPDSIVVFHPAD